MRPVWRDLLVETENNNIPKEVVFFLSMHVIAETGQIFTMLIYNYICIFSSCVLVVIHRRHIA